MLQGEKVIQRPVQVISKIGYLLVEPVEGVAYDPPVGTASTSKSWPQEGQCAGTFGVSGSLMRP